jgi:hypothetical protein
VLIHETTQLRRTSRGAADLSTLIKNKYLQPPAKDGQLAPSIWVKPLIMALDGRSGGSP